jgi:two-component system, cell cycle sensor histidine kinase and response regulator CckA
MAEDYEGEINLLLSDVVMPTMNGKDLAARLKTIQPNLKVLFMSGYTSNVVAHQGMLDKDIYFLRKPFSVTELTLKVREVLDDGEPGEDGQPAEPGEDGKPTEDGKDG